MPLFSGNPPQYNGYPPPVQPPSLFSKLREWLHSGREKPRSAIAWKPEYSANAVTDGGYHRKALRKTRKSMFSHLVILYRLVLIKTASPTKIGLVNQSTPGRHHIRRLSLHLYRITADRGALVPLGVLSLDVLIHTPATLSSLLCHIHRRVNNLWIGVLMCTERVMRFFHPNQFTAAINHIHLRRTLGLPRKSLSLRAPGIVRHLLRHDHAEKEKEKNVIGAIILDRGMRGMLINLHLPYRDTTEKGRSDIAIIMSHVELFKMLIAPGLTAEVGLILPVSAQDLRGIMRLSLL